MPIDWVFVVYLIAALVLVVVAQSAVLVVLARGRRSARQRADRQARRQAEARTVAHDFNNLLSVVLNYTSFVLEDLPRENPSRDDVLEIRNAAREAAALTHGLGDCGDDDERDAPVKLRREPGKRRAAA